MYIHTYICINIQEVHALQHTFWIVSRSNPPIRPMHLVESSCTLGSGFGTGIAPYHSSKPPTSESQQKVPMWKKTTRIFVGGFILIMFLKPRRNKRNVTLFYIFLFLLPFKTRHVFEKATPISLETTTVFDVPHRQSPGGGWRKRIQGGSPAKGGTTKYRAASEAHTSRVGRSVPEYLPPIWRIPTEKCKKKNRPKPYPWVLNIHVGLPCHQSMKRTLKTLI